jgi:hypothetical protein
VQVKHSQERLATSRSILSLVAQLEAHDPEEVMCAIQQSRGSEGQERQEFANLQSTATLMKLALQQHANAAKLLTQQVQAQKRCSAGAASAVLVCATHNVAAA